MATTVQQDSSSFINNGHIHSSYCFNRPTNDYLHTPSPPAIITTPIHHASHMLAHNAPYHQNDYQSIQYDQSIDYHANDAMYNPEVQFATPKSKNSTNSEPDSAKTIARKHRRRQRIITPVQRVAANARERKRMDKLNEAFAGLKDSLPTFGYEQQLSRIETLKLACYYISFLMETLGQQGAGVLRFEPPPEWFEDAF